jgi:hypothetical protein
MAWAAAAALALVPTACLFETADTAATDPASAHVLAYRVIPGARGKACRIEVDLRAWPEGEPKLFQAPVYYSDNPAYPVPGLHAADMRVRDGSGRAVPARDTVSAAHALDGNLFVLPPEARAFAYDVDLAPGDSGRFGVPIPGTVAGVDPIDGAYFFALPVLGRGFASQWRTRARISLDFVPVDGRALAGSDAHRDLGTPYELMFVRAAYDPARMLSRSIRGHELVVYATSDSSVDLEALGSLAERCIRAVEDSLLPLPTYRYYVGESPGFWGIEGIQGYWLHPGARNEPVSNTHEVIHTFVGVYHGDREDPWWKEGMTQYLGFLLPLQGGMISDTAFASAMLATLDTVPAVRGYALASPYVRNHLYPPLDSSFHSPSDPEDFIDLVYGKGAQAAMILERWILEGSGGSRSAYDLVRALIREGGPAFDRSLLSAETERLAGRPSAAFLSGLLDRAGAFPADSLAATYRALRKLGRLGPGGGKSPVAGIDGPAAKRGRGGVTYKVPKGGKL